MANACKQGLDYFSLSVDFFDDIKIRKIMREFGCEAVAVLIRILSNCYRFEGYYLNWDEDVRFLIADDVGVKETFVQDIVEKAVDVNFFDKDIFTEYKVLTSNGIQKRFFEATTRRKEVIYRTELLLNSDYVSSNAIDVNINRINVYSNQQSKVKESKVKESKVKQSKNENKNADDVDNFNSENLETEDKKNNTDENFEEVLKAYESSLKKDLANPRDYVGITKALSLYDKNTILTVIDVLSRRDNARITSFNYVLKVLETYKQEKDKQTNEAIGTRNPRKKLANKLSRDETQTGDYTNIEAIMHANTLKEIERLKDEKT